jgi:hypothetical protein
MWDLNSITLLLWRILLHNRKYKLVVYWSFKMASKVCNFHFEIADLICPMKNVTTPTQMSTNYNPPYLMLHDYFPAVENWLK